VKYAFVVGALSIDLGLGMDQLQVFGSAVSGNVSFWGRGGADSILNTTNFFDANVLMDGGDDADAISVSAGLGTETTDVYGAAGSDIITVYSHTTSRLNIDAGIGADFVEVKWSAIDLFFAFLSDDDDRMSLFANLLRLETDLDGGAGGADRLSDLGNDLRGVYRTRGFEIFS
jgi:hypothetical protein